MLNEEVYMGNWVQVKPKELKFDKRKKSLVTNWWNVVSVSKES